MNDDKAFDPAIDEEEEVDTSPELLLDAEEPGDLEEAIREALEAVEGHHGEPEPAPAAAPALAPEVIEEPATETPAAATAEVEEVRERLVRALADFDNYRKRTERERTESRRYAGLGILRELLPIVDNLERAVESEGPVDDLRTGVEMILKQTQTLLKRSGVERIPAVGIAFDPRVHEALSRFEEPDVSEPTVAEEHEAGYMMHDRLLRPARVRVAMPPEAEGDE